MSINITFLVVLDMTQFLKPHHRAIYQQQQFVT